MIKADVTVVGTVGRAATVLNGNDGQFVSFSVNAVIAAKQGINKTVEISVARDYQVGDDISFLASGKRLEITGTITFRKKNDVLYLNMEATEFKPSEDAADKIAGSLTFRGKTGKNIESKNDKKGNPYLVFSAFSTDKNGENFEYTWIRFMQFGKQKEEWLQSKTNIEASGTLQMGVFNDRLDITCLVNELSLWEKKPYVPNN